MSKNKDSLAYLIAKKLAEFGATIHEFETVYPKFIEDQYKLNLSSRFEGFINPFRIKITHDIIEFGVDREFDRWANSVDFVHYNTNPSNINKVLLSAALQYSCNNYSPDYGLCLELNTRKAGRILKTFDLTEIYAGVIEGKYFC